MISPLTRGLRTMSCAGRTVPIASIVGCTVSRFTVVTSTSMAVSRVAPVRSAVGSVAKMRAVTPPAPSRRARQIRSVVFQVMPVGEGALEIQWGDCTQFAEQPGAHGAGPSFTVRTSARGAVHVGGEDAKGETGSIFAFAVRLERAGQGPVQRDAVQHERKLGR